jgi:hypothetical protein
MPYTNLDITYWITGLYFMLIMVLVYLVSRPQGFCKITKWLLLFFYYDFKIVYKLDRSHLMVDALSRLPNQVELIGVFD